MPTPADPYALLPEPLRTVARDSHTRESRVNAAGNRITGKAQLTRRGNACSMSIPMTYALALATTQPQEALERGQA